MPQKLVHVKGRFAAQYDADLVLRTFHECGTQAGAARRLGMLTTTVGNIVRRSGIHLGRGRKPRAIPLPIEEITTRYLAGETCKEIASSFGVDSELVRKRLIAAKVPIRRRGAHGSQNAQWKGGRSKPMHYFRRQSYEVAAICLGHPVPQGWVIHHLDEVPENNQPENLILFESQRVHARFHQAVLRLQREGGGIDLDALALEMGGTRLPAPPNPIPL